MIRFLMFFLVFTMGCSSFEAKRVDSADDEMIDDTWTNVDATMTANTMINSLVNQSWLKEFSEKHNRKPKVIVDQIDNRTEEPYLDVKSLTDQIRTAIIKSGKIGFVDAQRRENVRKEMEYQHGGNVDPAQAKQLGKQTGAEYLLTGDIAINIQTNKNRSIKYYKVTLNLTNLETGEIDWAEQHEIKKKFKR